MTGKRPPQQFGMQHQFTVKGGFAPPAAPAPPDPRQALAQAVKARREGRLADAERLLRAVLSQAPENAEALLTLGTLALETGNTQAAEHFLSRAAAVDGENPEVLVNLGTALLLLGRGDEGDEALRKALARRPSHPVANYNVGLRALESSRFDEAARHLEKAVKAQPRNADALNAWGIALVRTGKPGAAVVRFRKALKEAPDHAEIRQNLANALADADQVDQALTLYAALVETQPGDPVLRFHHANALSKARKTVQAVGAYEEAIRLDPNYADAHNNLGNLLRTSARLRAAKDHLATAARLRPDDPSILTNLAGVLLTLGHGRRAREVCERVLELEPDNLDVRTTMVISLQNDGLFDDARAITEGTRHLGASPVKLICQRARDKSYRLTADEMQTLEAAIAEGVGDKRDLITACFTLGAALDGTGDYERAFRFYDQGNRFEDAEYQADGASPDIDVARVGHVFTPELFRSLGGCGSPSGKPVFIVGMPRSGTTLVEQILASHPDVVGGGELTEVSAITVDLAEGGGKEDYLDCIAGLDAQSVGAFAARYQACLDAISPDARHVTDKMPGNYLYLGLIALMFPNARIVHCRREPMATCTSIFFQRFDAFHPYAFDLRKLGRRYRQYLELMEHWRRVLPLPIHEVLYEDMVGGQEVVSRDLLAFCGLPWTDAVLRFHETERTVQTASLWQVRQPIYRTSTDHWRNYEAFLAPLREALAEPPSTP